ncbi:putative membrane protein [Serratia plymuthica A30]|nr:putative membrane protein [Serratia plymuthica A30]
MLHRQFLLWLLMETPKAILTLFHTVIFQCVNVDVNYYSLNIYIIIMWFFYWQPHMGLKSENSAAIQRAQLNGFF